MSENSATIVTGVSLLTIFVAKDDESYMAKCPELDLVTEMDTKEDALRAMVEMIMEYAEDYKSDEGTYLNSPNGAHHKPYIDAILKSEKLMINEKINIFDLTKEAQKMEAKLKLYDVKTLSELWRVAETTIYQLVHSGKLRAIRIGRSLRFREQDLEVYLDQNQESNKPKMNKHIYLRGITDNNDLADEDFEEAKKIWAVTE